MASTTIKSRGSSKDASGCALCSVDDAAQRSSQRPLAVVGIGASAGGLEALETLFKHMPVDTGMAFVVVTHLHPSHHSMMPELLGRATAMPVTAAVEGVDVRRDHVYVAPPGGQLSIIDGSLQREQRDPSRAPRLPVDHFFRSLALDQQARAVGVILSGTGSDGTLGLRAIKGESGLAVVQEPSSAQYQGMPESALAAGVVDYAETPADIPERLLQYTSSPYLSASAVPRSGEIRSPDQCKVSSPYCCDTRVTISAATSKILCGAGLSDE